MSAISDIVAAFSNAEGYGKPGAIPSVTNNPGDLKLGDLGYGTQNGITVFPTSQAGMDALTNQVTAMINGKSNYYSPDETISQIGDTYAAGDSNWSTNVANFLGISPDTKLSDIVGGAALGASGMYGTNVAVTKDTGAGVGSILNRGLEDWLFIVIGLILIAAGIFAFDRTQTIIKNIGSTAKAGAKTAAEIAA